MTIVSCDKCGKQFYKKPSQIKRSNKNYCSSYCQHQGKRKGETIKCFLCDKEVYKQRKAIVNSKSKKNFCSLKCSLKWHNHEFKEDNHGNWRGGEASYKKMLIRSNVEAICGLCGSRDTRILCVHHIDMNRKNNTIANLAWLCRNCHHLVHNYSDVKKKFDKFIVQKDGNEKKM